MNNSLNIIPTPKKIIYELGGILNLKTISFSFEKEDITKSALSIFQKEIPHLEESYENPDIIVFKSDDANEHISSSEMEIFKEKYAEEQGYILKKDEGKPVIIYAKSELGCAYGLMTLLQIANLDLKSFAVYDCPDFNLRANMWTIWAETAIASYDFGDGPDSYIERIIRKLDMYMKFKINGAYADGFGLDINRTPDYARVMRTINDEARKRGIKLYTGCYGMSYGSSAFPGAFYGKTYKNRKSYPDGEIYECIGSYLAWKMLEDTSVDRSKRLTEVRAREWGTCLSNDELTGLKIAEMKEYLKETHCGGFYLHNMDAYEVHPEMWLARCENCRKKWPNDDVFAPDGMAGAFAYYFGKIANELSTVKDGDYDASKHFKIMAVSPGYSYYSMSADKEYDNNIKFWSAVSKLIESNNVTAGFREQLSYQNKPILRQTALEKFDMKMDSGIINFSGADGFYDDKIFTITAIFFKLMNNFDEMINANGNAFQEPLQVFNAEYMWNSENSSFYNEENLPLDYDKLAKLFNDSIAGVHRPDEIYKDCGMIDVICEKIYGDKIGKKMAELTKLSGPSGEPPVACAANVDIYTRYNFLVYDFRWENDELASEKALHYKTRFNICNGVSAKACAIMKDVLSMEMSEDMRSDLEWLSEAFEMGEKLTSLLGKYMGLYIELDKIMKEKEAIPGCLVEKIKDLREKIKSFVDWLKNTNRTPFDVLKGSLVHRERMADHLDYWTSLMISSIELGKRVPDNLREYETKNWW